MEREVYTIEDVEREWAKFDELKETAEQYMFPKLMFWDVKLTPMYEDLKKNWDEHHALIFMKYMGLMFESFGIKKGEKNV